jgi:hypothetical protein
VNSTAAAIDDNSAKRERPESPQPASEAATGAAEGPVPETGADTALVWPPPDADLEELEVIAFDASHPATPDVSARAPTPSSSTGTESGGATFDRDESVGPDEGREGTDPRRSALAAATTGALAPTANAPGNRAPTAAAVLASAATKGRASGVGEGQGWPRWLVFAGGALGLVLAAVGGYLAAVRFAPAAPVSSTVRVTVASEPAGASVIVDGQPRGTTPLALDLPPAGVRLEVVGEFSRRALTLDLEAGRDVSYHFDFTSVDAEGSGEEAGVAADLGTIDIRTDPPGAVVIVEGRRRGETPLSVEGLTAGVHDVLLGYGGQSRLERVAVAAGQASTLSVTFGQAVARGLVAVQAPLPLEVQLEGRSIGTTGRPIALAAGSYDLEFVNDAVGFRRAERVTVTAGRTTTLAVEVPPGRVNVNAIPWAAVSVADVDLGDTPLANIALPAGEHEFVFRHPSLGERRRTVVVASGTTSRITVDFRP